jgi:hypothetical protein
LIAERLDSPYANLNFIVINALGESCNFECNGPLRSVLLNRARNLATNRSPYFLYLRDISLALF